MSEANEEFDTGVRVMFGKGRDKVAIYTKRLQGFATEKAGRGKRNYGSTMF
jgi:hypothetical protein